RKLSVFQLNGSHLPFPAPGGSVRFNWQVSLSRTNQNEPDWRSSSDEVYPHLAENEFGDYVWDGTYDYVLSAGRYEKPIRVWRNTDETNNEYKADMTVPLSRTLRFKTGANYQTKDRSHRERKFIYAITDRYKSYNGDLNAFFGDVGMRNGTYSRSYEFNGVTHYQFAYSNFLREDVELRNQYDGTQDVFAFYGMIETSLTRWLNFVGGGRFETTDMVSESLDSTYDIGRINEDRWLPSVNLIFKLGDATNIRTSYGRTLARPSLREMSPHYSEPFGLGRKTSGNAHLKQTLIDNYDLRWEWFMRPGEVAAVSGFYKTFENPIEMGFHGTNGGIQPQNASRAKLWGMEVELRSRLDRAWYKLRNFSLGGNLTLVHSEVKIPDEELADVHWYDPNASDTRPMWGQSPYIVNADISYEIFRSGTAMSLFYNVFGKRMAFNAEFPTGDVYEQPRHQLDLLASQRLFGGPTLKLAAKNLLNQNAKFVHEKLGTPQDDADGDRIYQQYNIGVTYSIGVSYQIW
ncbi:MAG TPA: TonB-dependent receptor, partial [candidate division Zixibacteria bacterium]|nr:TonB-dependent receptor [candidate division Zixibacteria bacterium]